MRRRIAFLFLWLCLATSALADSRVALVIGNSAYAAVGALSNPKDDAALVAETLGSEGFKVTLVQDARHDAMLKALRSFSREADQADWALVYYAGHGIEIGGVNYLLPVDVELREDRDAEDEAVSLDRVLRAVANAHKLRLVVLDACRNNPFAATMKRSIYTRAVVARGLAPAEPEPGTLVVYAAEAGQVAEDGSSGHSPFAAALAHRLQEPGLEVRRLFDVVTADVLDATGGHQRPYQYGSNPSREAFYFTPPAAATPSISEGVITAMINAAITADQLTSLIANLPEGPQKERAKARAEALKQTQPTSLTIGPSRPAPASPSAERAALSQSDPSHGAPLVPPFATGPPLAPQINAPAANHVSATIASRAPASPNQQLALLRSVTSSQSLAVGALDDLDHIGKYNVAEVGQDYSIRVDGLIKRILDAQAAQHNTQESDITRLATLEALEVSILASRLDTFESFRDEKWSAERLRIMILDRVENELGSLFDDTNRRAVRMFDLENLINKAAKNVYARLFETSEFLAAGRSSTRFVEKLYQIHGGLADGTLRKKVEDTLAGSAWSAGVAPIESSLQRDPNAHALRYRAERIIYDCLSDNVEAISSSDSGMATPEEIGKGMLDVAQQQCAKWVSSQMITDGKVKPQAPMPQRVIWTAEGPNDDPSMYDRPADTP